MQHCSSPFVTCGGKRISACARADQDDMLLVQRLLYYLLCSHDHRLDCPADVLPGQKWPAIRTCPNVCIRWSARTMKAERAGPRHGKSRTKSPVKGQNCPN